jgi:hypothetical protein
LTDYLIIEDNTSIFQLNLEYLISLLEDAIISKKRFFILLTKVDILNENIKNNIGLYELSQLGFNSNLKLIFQMNIHQKT